MMRLPEEMFESVGKIDWFSAVGDGSPDFLFKHKYISEKNIAESLFLSDDWADTKTEAQGDLTGYLAKYFYSSYGGVWNNLAKESHRKLDLLIGAEILKAIQTVNFSNDMYSAIMTDINRAILEVMYRDKFSKAPVFFHVCWRFTKQAIYRVDVI